MRKLIKFNEHGHLLISITNLGLTGSEEIERLEAGGYKIGGEADSILLDKTPLGYETKHCLEKYTETQIVLIPNKEIPPIETHHSIVNRCIEEYASSFNYRIPPAGIVPYLCVKDLFEELSSLDISDILIFHEPISANNLYPRRLSVSRQYGDFCFNDQRPVYVGTIPAYNDLQLRYRGATAFLAPD